MNLKFNKLVDFELSSADKPYFEDWFDFTAQTNLKIQLNFFVFAMKTIKFIV